MGCLGTGEAGHWRVAGDVQQPEVPRQPRRAMQAPRGLGREAQPWVQRSHPQDARANATGKPSAQGAGCGQLELSLEPRSVFGERPVNGGGSTVPPQEWTNMRGESVMTRIARKRSKVVRPGE